MKEIKLKKYKAHPLLKKCQYIKVKVLSDGSTKYYKYQPRLEKAFFESKNHFEILGFLDKAEQELNVQTQELIGWDYNKAYEGEIK